MTKEQILLGASGACTLLVLTVWLTRSRLISERLTLVWLAAAATALVFALFPQLLYKVAGLFGFQFASNALLSATAFATILYALYLTVKLSRLEQNVRVLTQHLALAKLEPGPSGSSSSSSSAGAGGDARP